MWQGSYEFTVNQWGVGHGGFHSQELLFQALDRGPTAPVGAPTLIRVVYDCGSGRGLRPAAALAYGIERMLDQVPNDSILDLLVISHFDNDHVNGLPRFAVRLRDRGIHVARIWTPVLSKIEALFAISRSGLRGAARVEYAQFLFDPVGTLERLFDGAAVSQIAADDEPVPFPRAEARDDVDAPAGPAVTLEEGRGGRGLVASAGGAAGARMGGEPLWEFQPYMVETPLVKAESVSEVIRMELGKLIQRSSLDELLALAADKAFLAKFHAAVRKHHRGLGRGNQVSSARTGANLSSLCVYSGPVSPYEWCHFRGGWRSVDETPQAIPIAPSWLGTGDAGLLRLQDVDAMRAVFTQNRLDRVGICSAPHHGSALDSGAPLWEAMPSARRVTIEAGNLVGGTGNNHPHARVLDELATRNLETRISASGLDYWRRDKRIR